MPPHFSLSQGVTSTSMSDQHFPLRAPQGETPEGLQKTILREERDEHLIVLYGADPCPQNPYVVLTLRSTEHDHLQRRSLKRRLR